MRETQPLNRDVITHASCRGSGRAWQTSVYLRPCSSGKRKEDVPFFTSASDGP